MKSIEIWTLTTKVPFYLRISSFKYVCSLIYDIDLGVLIYEKSGIQMVRFLNVLFPYVVEMIEI